MKVWLWMEKGSDFFMRLWEWEYHGGCAFGNWSSDSPFEINALLGSGGKPAGS
jgi:hypothetical protein